MCIQYKRNNRIVLRKCGDFYFLIDPKSSYNDEEEDILQINEMGKIIWESIGTTKGIHEIVSEIIELVVDESSDELITVIGNDIRNFLEQLRVKDYIGISTQ